MLGCLAVPPSAHSLLAIWAKAQRQLLGQAVAALTQLLEWRRRGRILLIDIPLVQRWRESGTLLLWSQGLTSTALAKRWPIASASVLELWRISCTSTSGMNRCQRSFSFTRAPHQTSSRTLWARLRLLSNSDSELMLSSQAGRCFLQRVTTTRLFFGH